MASFIKPSAARQACRLAQQTKPMAASLQAALAPRAVARPSILREASKVAAFHTSTKRAILPPLPQRLQGDANEAVAVHPPHPTHGAYHWQIERLVSAVLVPVTIAPFVGGVSMPIVDASLAGLILIHSHIGFESIITDYLPKKRVPKTLAFVNFVKWSGLVVVGYGLYEFETNDVGLCEGIKRIWHA